MHCRNWRPRGRCPRYWIWRYKTWCFLARLQSCFGDIPSVVLETVDLSCSGKFDAFWIRMYTQDTRKLPQKASPDLHLPAADHPTGTEAVSWLEPFPVRLLGPWHQGSILTTNVSCWQVPNKDSPQCPLGKSRFPVNYTCDIVTLLCVTSGRLA